MSRRISAWACALTPSSVSPLADMPFATRWPLWARSRMPASRSMSRTDIVFFALSSSASLASRTSQ